MLIPLKLAFTYFSFANKPTKLMILKFIVHKLWKVKEREATNVMNKARKNLKAMMFPFVNTMLYCTVS